MELGTLEFSGRAWPAAEIAGQARVIIKEGDETRIAARNALEIKARGRGKPYEMVGAGAWWRNFAALDPANEDAVLAFVRRRGDPFGELASNGYADTSGWPEIQAPLRIAAQYWLNQPRVSDPPISIPSRMAARRIAAFKALMAWRRLSADIDFIPAIIKTELGPKTSRPDFTFRYVVKTLASYMVMSAIAHVQADIEMTPCLNCGEYFHLTRRGSKFCSNSCRAAFAKAKAMKGETTYGDG